MLSENKKPQQKILDSCSMHAKYQKNHRGININHADSRGSVHRLGNTCNSGSLMISKTVPSIGKKEI